MSTTGFFFLAGATTIAATGVVFLRNPVHCAMSLVLALFLIAVNYIALEAHLVAAIQIIVYAGAVMVLFLFVIMLLNLQAEERESPRTVLKLTGAVASIALALLLGRTLVGWAPHAEPTPPGFGTTESLARVLFREHVVAFELTSLLLLVAIVGAIVLARRERP